VIYFIVRSRGSVDYRILGELVIPHRLPAAGIMDSESSEEGYRGATAVVARRLPIRVPVLGGVAAFVGIGGAVIEKLSFNIMTVKPRLADDPRFAAPLGRVNQSQ
jgi:hypothetical protein